MNQEAVSHFGGSNTMLYAELSPGYVMKTVCNSCYCFVNTILDELSLKKKSCTLQENYYES